MHILVVDDDPAVRASLRRALRLEGYSVGLARDGGVALAAVDADAPDVIVLDLMMPPPDGLEVCRRAGNRTPIDRFYRASAARPMPGSGQGLAIDREVVEAEGGTVRAGNHAGGGAVVEIHLQAIP
ncbi:MAG: two-component system, OmpR family, response regulator MprA [Actinomycetota bacterium]|nr:two-component system, OmpR family, response regulator MprA [Actinomycetota bacterium]